MWLREQGTRDAVNQLGLHQEQLLAKLDSLIASVSTAVKRHEEDLKRALGAVRAEVRKSQEQHKERIDRAGKRLADTADSVSHAIQLNHLSVTGTRGMGCA